MEPGADPWDGFLPGPENALAYAGVRALAQGDEGLSPLVLHGPAGAGKSRLLTGLVGDWLRRRPESAVAHLGAEAFAAGCAAATDPGGWAELRGRFRGLDLLVLEDLHDLDRAPLALEELAHTLDSLAASGAAVAASARSAPAEWSRAWPARLVSRLAAGLAVRVEPPGPEARRRYLLDRARAAGLRLAADAVDALADAADGYRTLDGRLARLALAARIEPDARRQVELTLEDEAAAPDVTVDQIARAVAARFGVTARALRSDARHAALVVPRHLALLLARERTGLSFAALGAAFGGRDAKTVRHACAAAARRLDADPALAALAEGLRRSWAK